MIIATVIPCYKVSAHILPLLSKIGPEVSIIVLVDDACPENSGALVEQECRDRRVHVVRLKQNLGVGGAVCRGYQKALELGAEVVVKIDGDGQMDPSLISQFVEPIAQLRADYVKGNRFYSVETLSQMPGLRLFGNSVLSFVSKASSGYWNLMDPTNGYTAIHRTALQMLPLDKLDNRYFFESDILFRLNTIRAVVAEVPMQAVYGDEKSNLRISFVAAEFPLKYLRCFGKRILYNYFLRDFNPCSLEIICGLGLLLFGMIFGSWHWYKSVFFGITAPTGTVMLAALPVMLGVQFLLAATNFDVTNLPKEPLQRLMPSRANRSADTQKLKQVANY